MKKFFILFLVLALALCSCALGEAAESDEFDQLPDVVYQELRKTFKPTVPYSEELNEKEKALDARLTEMKRKADSLYDENADYGIVPRGDEAILSSDLYQFCAALPKGGELHSHGNCAMPFDRYLSVIREDAMICLAEGDTYGYLYARNNPDMPEGCLPLSQVLDEGRLSEDELYEMFVISEADRESGFWKKLSRSGKMPKGLTTDSSLTERIYEEQYRSCIDNGILLLEIRSVLKTDDEANRAQLAPVLNAYYKVKKDFPDFTVRIIACSGKNEKYTVEEALETFRSAIRLSETLKDESDPENPKDFIIALDLVNEEDKSKPLSDYASIFLSHEITESGLKFVFHCGESLRMDNESVIDALLLSASRIGHGVNLYRYPELMEIYRNADVAVELCPISNHRLGYVYDLRLHPGLLLMRSGIPTVLCSDDGLFMTQRPQVDEFFAAILSWNLNLGDIKALCRNSIKYACLSQEETDRLMQAWESQWDAFVESF
jgi:adenosine deaminase-related growth factor